MYLGNKNIISESKQSIINLGYPDIIASLLYKKFGKNSFLISKWLREYSTFGSKFKDNYDNWWEFAFERFHRDRVSLAEMVKIYEAAKKGKEEYDKILKDMGFEPRESDSFDKNEKTTMWKEEIEEEFFNDIFFKNTIIQDIASGKIKNLQPYKNLSFQEAENKYDEKRIFDEKQLIKQYKNGWKWVDVGRRCQLVGNLMRNCGSAGVMSSDPDKTILTLFDQNNNPHAMVTYSPNEKRISGDEGQASTPLKPIYHKYILDLAKHLNVKFDAEKSKSKLLKLKSILQGKYKKIKKIDIGSTIDEYYEIELKNGKKYYSNGYSLAEKDKVDSIIDTFNSKAAGMYKIFNGRSEIKPSSIYQFEHIVKSLIAKIVKEEINHLHEKQFRGFSLKKFKTLKNQRERQKYLEKHLQKYYLGSGIGRAAYIIGNNKVIKLNHGMTFAENQTAKEVELWKKIKNDNLIPKVFDYDRTNEKPKWAIVELVKPIKNASKYFSLSENDLHKALDEFINTKNFNSSINKLFEIDELTKYDLQLLKKAYVLFTKHNLFDLAKFDHWGINANGDLLLLDAGI